MATESATRGTGDPTGTAVLVRRAWSEALGHDEFTDDDHFFQVGGHSLGALQVVRELGTALDRRISVRVLFRNPTVRALAEELAADPRGPLPRTADTGTGLTAGTAVPADVTADPQPSSAVPAAGAVSVAVAGEERS
ncbi:MULTISPECIES: acyl carrier protein [unclassified Streptomyces]|uniref:acyl carrier protein n=1 Tax=unclassified Streptomyces TaxID=2593676 RepID=UPI002DD7BD13|nr:acyl carrier protein [Streptomyces sp. NBC_01558]WSD76074.1 acyl carrier protein [Streptomyces sp. NBC_01558]